MRYRARTDANQPSIVDALRAVGCSVQILAAVGRGCPDILVGRNGRNVLMEIKDPEKRKADQKLTDDQVVFFEKWQGNKYVVKTIDDALKIMQGPWR